jgi:transcriptional regulator with XRE-family HTH domain
MLSDHLRILRKQEGLTQAALAERLGLSRAVIGAYEEGRAEPGLKTLVHMASLFKCTLDELVSGSRPEGREADPSGRNLRVLPVAVDLEGEEHMSLVPIKAAAGYAQGYGDTEFIKNLPHFRMPFIELSPKRSYRVFQIEGESMLPVHPGSYVLCEYLADWNEIKSDECHVVLTREDGVVYKRVVNRLREDGTLLMKSDNPKFRPFTLGVSEVCEVWRARGYVSFRLPEPGESNDGLRHVGEVLDEIRSDLRSLKQNLIH